MKNSNLARASSLDNAIVFDDFKVMNEDGVRYPEEPLRHKILDVIGDLYLSGYPVIGELSAHKSGHELNYALLTALLENEHAYEIVEFVSENRHSFLEGFYSPGYSEAIA